MADIYINGALATNDISIDDSLDSITVNVALSEADIVVIENIQENDTFEVILTIDGSTYKIEGTQNSPNINKSIRLNEFNPPLSRNSNKRIGGSTVLYLGGYEATTTSFQGDYLIKVESESVFDETDANETKDFLDEILEGENPSRKAESIRDDVISELEHVSKTSNKQPYKSIDKRDIKGERAGVTVTMTAENAYSINSDGVVKDGSSLKNLKSTMKARGYRIIGALPGGSAKHKADLIAGKKDTKISFTLDKSKAYEDKRKVQSIEALYAFNKVASILLTEPYLYTDTPLEARKELNRLRNDIFKSNILPCFYQTLEAGVCGKTHAPKKKPLSSKTMKVIEQANKDALGSIENEKYWEAALWTGGAIVGTVLVGLLTGGIGWVAAAGGATAVAVKAGAGAILSGTMGYYFSSELSDNTKTNLTRVRSGIEKLSKFIETKNVYYSSSQIKSSEKLLKAFNKHESKAQKEFHNKMKSTLEKALDDAGDSSTYANTIDVLSGTYFTNFPCFAHFRHLVYKMNANSKLNNLLKPDALEKKEGGGSDDQPLNFYSKQFLNSEVYAYLDFLISFPMVDYDYDGLGSKRGFFSQDLWLADEMEADEIFENKLDGRIALKEGSREKLKYSEGGPSYDKKKNLFEIQLDHASSKHGEKIYENYFKKNKTKIKQGQERKIKFLLALKEALIEEVISSNAEAFYENPKYRKYVESFSSRSVFKIMEDSAYPDIDLPESNVSLKKVKKLSPAFYYYSPSKEMVQLDEKVSRHLIKKSFEFKKNIREKIVINEPITPGSIEGELGIRGKSVITNVQGGGGDYEIEFSGSKSGLSSFAESDSDNSDSEKQSLKKFKRIPLPEISLNLNSFRNSNELKAYTKNINKRIEGLKGEVEKIGSLFGRKNFTNVMQGGDIYLDNLPDTNNKAEDLKKIGRTLGISRDLEYNSVDGLTALAKDSIEFGDFDKGMKKAFPTFRLYLVEEDSIFSYKLTAYDDFYSYASVISFSVKSSRELAATYANIQIQNVSGILDGTKKEVLRDIDVDKREIRSGDDDDFQKPIESIVLRNGINAQLRAGYENSTNDLDILISGVITEVNYGNDGMIANVILESYGTELESKIKKNLARDNQGNKFYSTHQLLGGLMLSPELKHFGKIKVGKIFQTGENLSPHLDINNYSNRSGFTWDYTMSWIDKLDEYSNAIFWGTILLGPSLKVGGWLLSKTAVTRSAVAMLSRGTVMTTAWAGKTFTSKLFWGARGGGNLVKTSINFANSKGVTPYNYFQTIKNNASVLNGILTQIKNGTLQNFQALTAAEQKVMQLVQNRLGNTIVTQLGENAFLATTAGIERQIVALAIKEQGMAFGGLKNFGMAALGDAWGAVRSASSFGITNTQKVLTGNLLQKTTKYIWGGGITFGAGLLRGGISTVGVGAGLMLAGLNATILLDVLDNSLEGLKSAGHWISELFSAEKNDSMRILLSPQDDNLFFPSVESYMVYDEKKKDNLLLMKSEKWLGNLFNTALFQLGSIIGLEGDKSALGQRFEKFKNLYDTRLVINNHENEYVVKSQTIFEIFHEMSLRHPGFVYGARPYGDSMEYRMFFGLPNQRYWAEDISIVDAIRVNKILKEVSVSDQLDLSTCKMLYPEETSRLESLKEGFEKGKVSYNKASSGTITKKTTRAVGNVNLDIQQLITELALKEYLEKSNKRFKPFRKMHLLNSYENIVSNNIVVSGHDIINAVVVHYANKQGDNKPDNTSEAHESIYSMNLLANTAIPENMQKQKAVTASNIIGPAAAYRYGMGELLYGAKNMYQGSILTLGNTKIHPWDVVILDDDVNRMYGPLEVKSVTHMFSHQTGFLTDVEVNALVAVGEDSLTYPMIEQTIIGKAREKLYQEYSSRSSFERAVKEDSETFYNNLLENIIEETFEGTAASAEFKKEVQKHYSKKVSEALESAKKRGVPVFLNDIINPNAKLPPELRQRLGAIGQTGIVAGGIAGGLGSLMHQRLKGKMAGLILSKSPLGVGYAAFMALSTSLAVGSGGVTNMIESSLRSGNLGKNMFRPVLFSKISNQNLIEIYPIVKDGKPLLGGGFEGVPAAQSYKNVLGNIFSQASDALEGYYKYQSEIESEGPVSVLRTINGEYDFVEVKPAMITTAVGVAASAIGFGDIGREIITYAKKTD
jgi:hypothetical protein